MNIRNIKRLNTLCLIKTETQIEHEEQTIKSMLRSRCQAEEDIAIEVFDEIVIEQFMLFRTSVESIFCLISMFIIIFFLI